jgi:hypothetical protein
MPLTNTQKHLAQTIDRWVHSIEQRGGGDAEILEGTSAYLPTLKHLMDVSTQDEMDLLCTLYPGFYRFGKLVELIAQGLHDGTISVPPTDAPTQHDNERVRRVSKLLLLEWLVPLCVRNRTADFLLPPVDPLWFETLEKAWNVWSMTDAAFAVFEQEKLVGYTQRLVTVSPTFPDTVFAKVDEVIAMGIQLG